MEKPQLTKEQKLVLADRITEAGAAETETDRHRRDEKTARLRALRLARDKSSDA